MRWLILFHFLFLTYFLGISCQSLRLLVMKNSDTCSSESSIFNITTTAVETILYASHNGPPGVPQYLIYLDNLRPTGCCYREDNRGESVTRILANMTESAETTGGFSVFVGPSTASDCSFVASWLSQRPMHQVALKRLYQVEYLCQLNSFIRKFPEASKQPHDEETPVAAVSIAINAVTIAPNLELLLRAQGWRRLAIVYEVSDANINAGDFAMALKLSLNSQYADTRRVEVVVSEALQPGINGSFILQTWAHNVDGKLKLNMVVLNHHTLFNRVCCH